MMPSDLAWLAGYLEGEGCFHLPGTPCIQVGATDEDVVAKAAALMGAKMYTRKVQKAGWSTCYVAVIRGQAACDLMRAVLPYMGSRRAARIKEVLTLACARPGVARGERSGRAKLTDSSILEMRHLAATSGVNQQELASKYGVSSVTISQALCGKAWQHVGGPLRVPHRGKARHRRAV